MRWALYRILIGSLVAVTCAALFLLIFSSPAPAAKKPAFGGPDLPYSCATVRWAAAIYTVAQLEEIRKQHNLPEFTPKQKRQARECLVVPVVIPKP